jgi:hypothetical protein
MKPVIVNRTKNILSFLGPLGFQALPRTTRFEKGTTNGHSSIAANLSYRSGTYYLAFYLGVGIAAVEDKRREIAKYEAKSALRSWTIWAYTMNFGPGSPHYDFPIRGRWEFETESELSSAAREIEKFTRELSLPYLEEYADPLEIRSALLGGSGRAHNTSPYEEILTIDLLYLGREALRTDVDLLRERYKSMFPPFKAGFEEFATAILQE